ncbi:MAG TPA: hypothetical protein ENO08_05385 [Candidatus Eisenbacteria bacterium]|uniref:Uncharacterized protein n=1 Tax=Eiseniibacteriota bacterium TaxID=2212470 RepID=A0A7V2AV71_UNCEI|nr:hypothetical protein [Candidatus Eisenbacteria bacterium]
MLTALKNVEYGFESTRPRSRGGTDGIFLIDRTHKPKNEMMRKLFDRFIDKPAAEALEISEHFGIELGEFMPVRVVSHDLRLLGLLHRKTNADILILVDCDRGT